MSSTEMQRLIETIEKKVSATGHELVDGATQKEIDDLEKLIGAKLPMEVKAFYLAHDGNQKEGENILILTTSDGKEYEMMSLQDVVSEVESMSSMFDEEFSEYDVKADSGIRKEWWMTSWIPVCHDNSGNFCCIDLMPVDCEMIGQIISVDFDDCERTFLCNSFLNWLANDVTFKDVDGDDDSASTSS